MKDPSQNRVGRELAGRFEILRVLGEGGMGVVYEARQKFTGRHVALKTIHPGIAESPIARERFFREAKAPNAIGHPAIVEVLDAGIADDGTLYLALELLHGEDLGQALRARRITADEAIRIGADVLEVLAVAHEKGLVHRDIKPENVFLARDGSGYRVRLLDFGVIRHLGDLDSKLTSPGTVLGTPYYMSPEQTRGEPVDGRADLWSVGAMLYHALTGKPPFPGENYNMVIAGILTEPAPRCAELRPDLPAALGATVDRALEKDRDARWSSAREMAAALTSAATSLPPGALPEFELAPTIVSDAIAPSVRVEPKRGAPSPWLLVGVAGGLVVVGALGLTLLAGLYVGRRSAEPRPDRSVQIGMNVIIGGEPFDPSTGSERCLRACPRDYERCRTASTDHASLQACTDALARCNDRCLGPR